MKIQLLLSVLLASAIASAQTSQYEQFLKNTMDGTKYGIKDKQTDREIIPAIYDKVIPLEEKFAVIKDAKVGIVDTANKVIVPVQYADVSALDDRIFVFNGKKWAICDDKGKFLTQFLYGEILGYNEGVVRVSNNSKIGYVTKDGQSIFSCKFEEGYDCYGDFILIYGTTWENLGLDIVKRDIFGKEISRQNVGMTAKIPVLYNKKGELLYKGEPNEKIQYAPDFNIAICEKYIVNSGTYNKVIAKSGTTLIPYDYKYVLSIEENWIRIRTTSPAIGGWVYGIISFDGVIILKPNFSNISDYSYNNAELAKVSFYDASYFYIDKNAKCIEFENHGCPE
jgi:hypothetical protein